MERVLGCTFLVLVSTCGARVRVSVYSRLVTVALLSMTAGCSQPEPGAIVATSDGRGATTYTYTLPVEGRSGDLVIGWEGVDCGEFSITTAARTSTYLWNHGVVVERTPRGKPPCGEHTEPGHANAVITATVTAPYLYRCVYRGTASGRGEPCEAIPILGRGPTGP
jgi:hypothetical protein